MFLSGPDKISFIIETNTTTILKSIKRQKENVKRENEFKTLTYKDYNYLLFSDKVLYEESVKPTK